MYCLVWFYRYPGASARIYISRGKLISGIHMSKVQSKLLKTIEKAGDAAIADDIKLLKKLAKR